MRNEIILRSEQQRDYAIGFLRDLVINPERPFSVTIEPHKKKRSLSQNSLLWKRHADIVKAIGDYTGYSAEDVHELLKQKFLPAKIIEVNGVTVKRYSSKGLTVGEFSEFMEKIEAFAQTELGLVLTQPEERFAER